MSNNIDELKQKAQFYEDKNDYKTSCDYYKQAADLNDAESQLLVAIALMRKENGKNVDEAIKYVEKAYRNGEKKTAMNFLVAFGYKPVEVMHIYTLTYEDRIKFLKKSIELGQEMSNNLIGDLYLEMSKSSHSLDAMKMALAYYTVASNSSDKETRTRGSEMVNTILNSFNQ